MSVGVPAGQPRTRLRPMREEDLEAVMRIELRAYPFPWTQGIFRDCLRAGYPAWILESDAGPIGYGVLSVGAGEAHLLNVCIEPGHQGQGHGRRLLRGLERVARGQGARRVFLEVRPSNPAAIALYQDEGFNEIGRRPRYYPAHGGREDAIVMAKELLFDDWA
ncbi:MAG: ribosomal protein S18-alanine N-acetyltransferase [Chloroflexi bacterium]|jgi:ribosomal-protein-alanine N-acetyltransferase|uniref:[Ribosomal protein bS18]-alanine N-acetyltransferase n=1 Tax=Luteimonas wenzhouensis TaxID=2599615 RepID=A0A5C5U4D4_9GAMM|nr:ribosomal protein S18-alanine N-acetyltransferase [Luteimonas wenzhouensis]NLF79324.1 ribosomal protein S18-alanine N-acetyltransferase [Chloroflexota bacterium]TWT20856.1 ribosomal-protein-alanine N-acetyltransferase [Luteimonas wenzhouensis]